MKAILTVIGKDKVGIIAGVSNELQRLNINILDVNQTIIDEFFTMIMMLDLKLSNSNFEEIKKSLELKGKSIKDKNILSRFLIKLDLVNIVMLKLKEKRKKREKMMLRNNLSVKKFDQNIHLIDIIYMSAFILLLCIHISKVI